MRNFALALAIAFAVPSADAIVMRHDRDPARYAALGEKFPAVGMLDDQVTCTLIAPRWALSAAHTIEDRFNPVTPPFATFAGKKYEIDKAIVHPRRIRGSVDSAADLVLLHLRQPVEGIAPVLLYDRDDEPEKIATIVGYGETGNGRDAARNDRGKAYGAQNKVEAVFENSLIFTFDPPPSGLELEGIPGPGDSGCPALLEENGKVYTLGVGSFNTGSDETASSYGTVDAFARVSTHRTWIIDTMQADPPSTIPMFGAYVRGTSLPSSPAGKVAKALLDAFNSGDIERMAAYYRKFGRRRPDDEIRKAAASWQKLMEQYGAYEVKGSKTAGPYAIAIFVRATKGGLGRVVGVQLDREGEHRVERIVMRDLDTPGE